MGQLMENRHSPRRLNHLLRESRYRLVPPQRKSIPVPNLPTIHGMNCYRRPTFQTGFSWALASGAGLMALRTLTAIKRQADMQGATLLQWADVEEVGCAREPPKAGRKDPFVVNIQFVVVNNTANVFTLLKIETAVSMSSDETEVFTIDTNTVLSPRRESESNRCSFYIPVQSISEEWFRTGTVVTINGHVTFIDCMNQRRAEYFGGLYECGPGKIEKITILGMVPDRAVEDGVYIPGELGNISKRLQRMIRSHGPQKKGGKKAN